MRFLVLFLGILLFSGCAAVHNERVDEPAEADVAIVDTVWLNRIIEVFSKEIATNPLQPGLYYNRAVAYYYRKDYDKSWEDIRQVKKLSGAVDQRFLKKLQSASGVKE